MTRAELWNESNGLMDLKDARHHDNNVMSRSIISTLIDVWHDTYIVVCSCTGSIMYVTVVVFGGIVEVAHRFDYMNNFFTVS